MAGRARPITAFVRLLIRLTHSMQPANKATVLVGRELEATRSHSTSGELRVQVPLGGPKETRTNPVSVNSLPMRVRVHVGPPNLTQTLAWHLPFGMRTWARIGTTPIRPPRICDPLRWQAPPAQPWVFASLPVKTMGRSVDVPIVWAMPREVESNHGF